MRDKEGERPRKSNWRWKRWSFFDACYPGSQYRHRRYNHRGVVASGEDNKDDVGRKGNVVEVVVGENIRHRRSPDLAP